MAVTGACPRASAAENPMLHVQGLLTIRKADQFMRISNTEYSRNENFDLTRMFNNSVLLFEYTKQPWLTTSESFSSFHYFS